MSVKCIVTDNIAHIILDDNKANAVNEAMCKSLLQALDAAEQAKSVVLSGRTGFFCAGLDLKSIPALQHDAQRRALDAFEHVTRRLASFPKPIVAALAGHALGAGACFALACDFVIAQRGTYRVGLNEASIGVPLPPFLLELGRLKLHSPFHMRAFVHGEVFTVDDAQRVGYIDELVDSAEDLGSAAKSRAEMLAGLPNDSYLATKQFLRKFLIEMPYPQIAQYVGPAFQKMKAPSAK